MDMAAEIMSILIFIIQVNYSILLNSAARYLYIFLMLYFTPPAHLLIFALLHSNQSSAFDQNFYPLAL